MSNRMSMEEYRLQTGLAHPEPKKNKYGNIPCVYNGERYDSQREAEYARDLDLRMHESGGSLVRWERQVNIPMVINGIKICDYRIDFVETHRSGLKIFVEIKGHETAVWKLKWKLLAALYPKCSAIVVK